MDVDQQKIIIKLRVEWHAGPFSVVIDDSPYDDYQVEEIHEVVSLSDELTAAISEWNEKFQSISNAAATQDSDMQIGEAEKKFNEEGRELARRIKREVPPHVIVSYVPLRGIAETMK